MGKQYQQQSITQRPVKGINIPYLAMNISIALLLPLASLIAEHIAEKTAYSWHLTFKWMIFWAVGIRLFSAGLKQASQPEFTAAKIFNLQNTDSNKIIRELGFANIALGVMGILSVTNDQWRLLAAVSSGIFFGLAAAQHALKKADSANEVIALVYDLYVFLVLAGCVVFTIFFQLLQD